MKPALIFHQYIWLINTLRRYHSLTLGRLNRKWMDTTLLIIEQKTLVEYDYGIKILRS